MVSNELGVDTARGVVVGRDARHGSEPFNDEVVTVLLGAGVKVYEMPGPLPTPLVAYCVKALGAAAGIMITASHNPPLDNGYKLYSSDGSQIIPPNDEIVERLRERGRDPADWASDRVRTIGGSRHDLFARVPTRTSRERFARRRERPCDHYTPLHGVGGATMMAPFR